EGGGSRCVWGWGVGEEAMGAGWEGDWQGSRLFDRTGPILRERVTKTSSRAAPPASLTTRRALDSAPWKPQASASSIFWTISSAVGVWGSAADAQARPERKATRLGRAEHIIG